MTTTERSVSPDAAGTEPWTRGLRIVLLMARSGHELTAEMARRTGDMDLTGNTPSLILAELALRGPLRPRDLMATTDLTSGGMTKQLDHLEQLGLIERSFGTLRSDRRASVIELTPIGIRTAALLAEAIEARAGSLRTMAATLTALLDD